MAAEDVSTDDYNAIANLMGRYQHLVDGDEEDAWVSLFTDDGAFIGRPEELDGPSNFRGRAELRKLHRIVRSYGGLFRHFMGSFTVRYGDNRDEAFADYYVLALNWQKQGAERLDMFTLVHTHLVRRDGRWKIATNTMSPL